ncbi:MAG: ribonuclease H-like YkuK family protein [Candidatus Colwellbacteria bacterium]|nr:ribonuclease H-like YkuK family protein [Candidatus Colwellbacteria bacterium]
MREPTEILFKDSRGNHLDPRAIAEEITAFMNADSARSYKVTIGTDSLLYADKSADFVTAVVVHRIGNGGRYFWRRASFGNFYTLRDRILKEVLVSLDLAKLVIEQLRDIGNTAFDLEIHVDAGEKGDTRQMIQELVGIIRANNFEARTKPQSYAASCVADRHV